MHNKRHRTADLATTTSSHHSLPFFVFAFFFQQPLRAHTDVELKREILTAISPCVCDAYVHMNHVKQGVKEERKKRVAKTAEKKEQKKGKQFLKEKNRKKKRRSFSKATFLGQILR
jgi:hypothetical protein